MSVIIISVALGIFLPIPDSWSSSAHTLTSIAVAFLFYLYGARLSTGEMLQGLTHWRLHLLILCITFVIFPLIALLLFPVRFVLSPEIYIGIIFLSAVPSTLQSSVTFTSIARGNVPAAIVAASLSSILGVILTPLLIMILLPLVTDASSTGIHIDLSVIENLALQLLLPFALGQLTRRWVSGLATHPWLKRYDHLTIGFVVYSAFSEGMNSGIWGRIPVSSILWLIVGSIVLVEFMFWFSGFISDRTHFPPKDRIAIQFAGTKKSLATGVPMAAVIFAGGAGTIILPLMIFHQIQLIICSIKAQKLAQEPPPRELHL